MGKNLLDFGMMVNSMVRLGSITTMEQLNLKENSKMESNMEMEKCINRMEISTLMLILRMAQSKSPEILKNIKRNRVIP